MKGLCYSRKLKYWVAGRKLTLSKPMQIFYFIPHQSTNSKKPNPNLKTYMCQGNGESEEENAGKGHVG